MIELLFVVVVLLFIIAVCTIAIVIRMDMRPKNDDASGLRVQLAAAQGAVNQLQTRMCYSVNTDPAKLMHTVLTMHGVNIEMKHIPEQIMDAAAKGDYEELAILFKVFYGIEITGVKI